MELTSHSTCSFFGSVPLFDRAILAPRVQLGSGSRRLSSGQLSDAAPHTFSLGSLF